MKRLSITILVIVQFATVAFADIQVFFSPNGGCTEAIVKEISEAKETILVQAYSFTSAPIAGALRDAHKRGIKVTVLLDSSQKTANYSSADFLRNSGIATLIDSKHAIAHNKIIIIDNEKVITGSFNFSKSAEERNSENVLIITDSQIAMKYSVNWNEHYLHCEIYEGRVSE